MGKRSKAQSWSAHLVINVPIRFKDFDEFKAFMDKINNSLQGNQKFDIDELNAGVSERLYEIEIVDRQETNNGLHKHYTIAILTRENYETTDS